MPPKPRDPAERFWGHVDKDGAGGCWLWTGSLNHLGYARFFITIAPRTRVSIAAHTFAYESLVGPSPTDLEPDHLCRVRHCVNPAHIEWVTHQENVRRGTSMVATNVLKTHCPQGHEYTLENTRIGPKGKRYCRICTRRHVKNSIRRRNERERGIAF